MRIFGVLLVFGALAFGQTSLVLYSSGLALVEDTKKVQVFEEGVLELGGLPSGIIWDSLMVEGVEPILLRPLGDHGLLYYRAEAAGEKELRFRYLTQGLAWKIVYDAEFLGTNLRILGKAMIQNDTGLNWQKVKLTLIAGEVRSPARDTTVKALAMAPEASVSQAFEYHRYDLPGTWDLPSGQAVLALLKAEVPTEKVYQFAGSAVEVRLRFSSPDNILPAGEMRVYSDGIFVGASSIPHLPKGESAEIVLGAAFDLTGKRTQLSRERLQENLYRDSWRIELRSAKDEDVVVEVIETLPGYWRIVSSTMPYEVLDAQRVKFAVPVNAGGKAVVDYTVEWRY